MDQTIVVLYQQKLIVQLLEDVCSKNLEDMLFETLL